MMKCPARVHLACKVHHCKGLRELVQLAEPGAAGGGPFRRSLVAMVSRLKVGNLTKMQKALVGRL